MGLVNHLVRSLVDPLTGFLVGSPYEYWEYEETPDTPDTPDTPPPPGGDDIPWPPPELPEEGQAYVVTSDALVVMTHSAEDWVVVSL